MNPLEPFFNFFSSPLFSFLVLLLRIFLVVMWVSVAYWVYRDARNRGSMPVYWAIVNLLFPLLGLVVYFVVRPPELVSDLKERELEIKAKEALLAQTGLLCPACMKPVESDFLLCPYCLKKLKKACPQCDHALKLGWTICPYCQTGL